jgi:DTW domain-containing protein YfiP
MTPRCHACFRPRDQCICRWLRPVDTATAVTVLQHPGERKHAFNTARLVPRVLRRGRLEVVWPDAAGRMASSVVPQEGAVLLYPSDEARLVDAWEGPPPSELVVLDGTWSQVRRLLADNPWLTELPAVKLAPARGSNYRIREEPAPHCLSTIESVAQALRGFEPDNVDLTQLLTGFERMVDHHLAARPAPRPRYVARERPTALDRLQAWGDVVVVYAETLGRRGTERQLLQWAAVRPASGEVFDGRVRPEESPNPCVLAATELDLHDASSLAVLRHRWRRFLRADDVLFAWTSATDEVATAAELGKVHGLKEWLGRRTGGVKGDLGTVVRRMGWSTQPVTGVAGRGARRLGHAVSVAAQLAGR